MEDWQHVVRVEEDWKPVQGRKTWRDYCLRGLKMSLHSVEAGKMTYIEQEVNARQPL